MSTSPTHGGWTNAATHDAVARIDNDARDYAAAMEIARAYGGRNVRAMAATLKTRLGRWSDVGVNWREIADAYASEVAA